MNWIKENKFLFGFIVVMVIGVGVGTWFLLGAKGRNDEATETYQRKVGELNRLQRLPTFPNQKNLEKIAAQQTDVNNEVSALATELAAQQLPLEDLTPEQFQDKLKATVTAVHNRAGQTVPAVKVPEPKFFLGFERYETAPPAKEAASVLGRELKAIEWVCNQLIDNKVSEIRKLDREELLEEKPGGGKTQRKAAPAPAKAAPGKGGKPGQPENVKHDVEKHRIEIVFFGDQRAFRNTLNAVVAYKGQFFIPRLVMVKNEKPTGPPHAAPTAPEAAPAAPEATVVTPAPGTAPAAPAAPAPPAAPAASSTYIVGEEKIEATLVLEMIDFITETAAK
ncbi:MAG TPA: Amuc_1100 family pilus-like protein [Chthoniobacteraceae bacterium]|nr:Amuc_1100 family pilus-like protein [Chthoniobacteraceae bacterium]